MSSDAPLAHLQAQRGLLPPRGPLGQHVARPSTESPRRPHLARALGQESPTPPSPAQKSLSDCHQPPPPKGGTAWKPGPLTPRGLGAGACTCVAPALPRGLDSPATAAQGSLPRGQPVHLLQVRPAESSPAPTWGPGSSVRPRAHGLKVMAMPCPQTQSTESRRPWGHRRPDELVTAARRCSTGARGHPRPGLSRGWPAWSLSRALIWSARTGWTSPHGHSVRPPHLQLCQTLLPIPSLSHTCVSTCVCTAYISTHAQVRAHAKAHRRVRTQTCAHVHKNTHTVHAYICVRTYDRCLAHQTCRHRYH